MKCWLLCAFAMVSAANVQGADPVMNVSDENDPAHEQLRIYEPNFVGCTYDDDDQEPFLDFKLSLQYPFFASGWNDIGVHGPQWLRNHITGGKPYIAFSGRFGQYIATRDSSPVIAKRFNPKLFYRLQGRKPFYLDLEYAHESNGQRISTLNSYNNLADDLEDRGDRRGSAVDYISRGWDYYGATLKMYSKRKSLSFYVSYAKYIGGLLQGDIEEYFSWEGPREINSRDEVDGLRFILKWDNGKEGVGYQKAAYIHTTGTHGLFEHNTSRLEYTVGSLGMPVMLWVQTGYNSDLAQYYRYVTSGGIAFEFR